MEHVMPDQAQGSESKEFQSDKTICGSSIIASLKFVRAQTVQNPFLSQQIISNNKFKP